MLITLRHSTSCFKQRKPLDLGGTKSVSTFARRYRANKALNIQSLTAALDASIAATLSQTQARSFSHLYRRHKGTLYVIKRTDQSPTHQQPVQPITFKASQLLQPSQRRTFSAIYRHHHVTFLSRIYSVLFPALLPPKEMKQTKYRMNSVPEILASRGFSHRYRERQLAPIREYLPRNPFSRRSASSIPLSSYAAHGHGMAPVSGKTSRRLWRLRLLGAFLTSALALGYVSQMDRLRDLPALSETEYLPWRVVNIERVSPTTSIFTLQTDSTQPLAELPLITSISVKEPNANIQRPYTVLSSHGDSMQILVKRYDNGDLSRFIHSRAPAGILQVKQVLTEPLPQAKRYVFIVGGTGIAPVYQCLQKFDAMKGDEKPDVEVLYASRSQDEVYLRAQLDAFQTGSDGRVKVQYFVDDQGTQISTKNLKKYTSATTANQVILVCGPDGFVEYVAGEKPEVGQGAVGGLLAKAGITQNVLKL